MSNNTTTSQPFSCDESVYPQCFAARLIWKTIPPLLFVLGNLGNILSIIVLCRPRIRKYSVAMYLLFLAISDLTFLWSSVFRNTLYRGYGIDLKKLSFVHCRLNDWATMTSGAFSSYLVSLLTIERAILIKWSRNNQVKSTPKRVCCALLILAVIIAIGNLHLIYGYNTITETVDIGGVENKTTTTESRQCVYISSEYKKFYSTTWNFIVFLLYNVLPLCIIATGNITIAVILRKQKNMVRPSIQNSVNNNEQNSRSNTATRTLFVLSVFYMLTVTPYCILRIVQGSIESTLNEQQFATMQLVYALIFVLGYLNFSLNFFMYSNGASLFRNEYKALVNGIKTRIRDIFCRD